MWLKKHQMVEKSKKKENNSNQAFPRTRKREEFNLTCRVRIISSVCFWRLTALGWVTHLKNNPRKLIHEVQPRTQQRDHGPILFMEDIQFKVQSHFETSFFFLSQ